MLRALPRRSRGKQIIPICGLVLLLALLSGCNGRRQEIVGTWEWNDEIVQFLSDGTWSAYKTSDPAHPDITPGNWTMEGNSVTLSFFNFEPREQAGAWSPDEHFTLDHMGRKLTGIESDAGSMIKL